MRLIGSLCKLIDTNFRNRHCGDVTSIPWGV